MRRIGLSGVEGGRGDPMDKWGSMIGSNYAPRKGTWLTTFPKYTL